MRILHVVHGLGRGGVETWLMHVLRALDRNRYQSDFLVGTPEPQAYDEEARALGSRIVYCAPEERIIRYSARLKRILATNHYDIVHSHLAYYSGLVLRVAHSAGIPQRIAHIHSAKSADGRGTARDAALAVYRKLMRNLVRRHATRGLANSDLAGQNFFASAWNADPRFSVLLYGFDFSPFASTPVSTEGLRAELGIDGPGRIVGHVGRFNRVKNHEFLLHLFARLHGDDATLRLVLVGDGPLRGELQEQARSLGIGRAVVFAGEQQDVARWMRCFDVFVFPSFHEGLGIVAVEAQAAGVRVVMADTIPSEAGVTDLVTRVALSAPIETWAGAVRAALQTGRADHVMAYRAVADGPFGITRCIEELDSVYGGERTRQRVPAVS